MPIPRPNLMETKPILQVIENTNGETTFQEEVSGRLLHVVAKLAKAAILPTSFLESSRPLSTPKKASVRPKDCIL
jgi:hypothetical protein